jgi:hypothetical protein
MLESSSSASRYFLSLTGILDSLPDQSLRLGLVSLHCTCTGIGIILEGEIDSYENHNSAL